MAKKTDPMGAPSTKKKAKPTKKKKPSSTAALPSTTASPWTPTTTTAEAPMRTTLASPWTPTTTTATKPEISEGEATEDKEGYTSYGAIEDPEAAAAVTQSVIENAIFTQHFKYALPFTYISVLPQKIIFNALVESQVIEESENFNKLTNVMTILKHHEIYTIGNETIDSTRYEALIPDSSKSLSVDSIAEWPHTYIEVSIDAGEQSALDDKFGFSPVDAPETSFADPKGIKFTKVRYVVGNIIAANVSIVEPPADSKISYIFNKIKNDKLTDQNTQILTDLSPAARNK